MQQIPISSRKTCSNLNLLADRLSQCESPEEKLTIFSQEGWSLPTGLSSEDWDANQQVVLISLGVVSQLEILENAKESRQNLDGMIENLIQIEDFYGFMGGVVGYHAACLELSKQKTQKSSRGIYHKPTAHDISVDSEENRRLRLVTLQHLNELAAIFPIGGAADRLSRRSSQIAATRLFCEKSLLEYLVDDIKAKEALAKSLYGIDVTIPIVLMTSDEKKGTKKIRALLESEAWFGRDPDAFFLVAQPLVPAMTFEGRWISTGPGKLLLKPGGHGVLWKVCRDQGALRWLKEKGKTKVFVRQINNPVAGVDDGLYTFIGYGLDRNKDFGFASCPRANEVSEGVDVVIETDEGFTLTNIEYCDFEHYRVDSDADLLANTNVLFAAIETIEKVLDELPVPGMLINAKEVVISSEADAMQQEVIIRLESTMQNLADGLVSPSLPTRTYITTNRRQKTISPIKRESQGDQIASQTPEQCFVDMQLNARELLLLCQMNVGEGVLFEYHPCLGPFYDIISQKLRECVIAKGSHMDLSISQVDIEELTLDGALTIKSEVLKLGEEQGSCFLSQVRVVNRGLDRDRISSLASSPRVDYERCRIIIGSGGEFHASNITFEGDFTLRVAPLTRVTAVMDGEKVKLLESPIKEPTWTWKYELEESGQITLKKRERE